MQPRSAYIDGQGHRLHPDFGGPRRVRIADSLLPLLRRLAVLRSKPAVKSYQVEARLVSDSKSAESKVGGFIQQVNHAKPLVLFLLAVGVAL